MTKGLHPIYTQTVGAGGVASVTFNNIPQGYNDLLLYVSAKTNQTGASLKHSNVFIRYNGDSSASSYSNNHFYGTGTAVSLARDANMDYGFSFVVASNDSNAATFGVARLLLSDYSVNGKHKQSYATSAGESEATTANVIISHATCWRKEAPVVSMTIAPYNGASLFLQHSSFTLYGIAR